MKRRSFVKKSFASAIVAATPLALTGLVNAAGNGSGALSETTSSPNSTTGWFGTTHEPESTTKIPTTTWFSTTSEITYATTIVPIECTVDMNNEFVDLELDQNGNPKIEGGKWVAWCWRQVSGCMEAEGNATPTNIVTSNIPRRCDINPNDISNEGLACLELQNVKRPKVCPALIGSIA